MNPGEGVVKSVRATDFTLGNVTAVATTRAGPALGTFCRSAWRSEIEHIAVLRVAVERDMFAMRSSGGAPHRW